MVKGQDNKLIAREVKKDTTHTLPKGQTGWRFFRGGADAKKGEEKASQPKETKKVEKKEAVTPKLRSTIKPGCVLIILSGRFAGVRVVFLKQLKSGLLLVTGPFKYNGCPIRRINQAYVIATSTKVDLSSVKIPEHINDAYFAREKKESTGKTREERFLERQNHANDKEKAYLAKRKEDQKAVDSALIAVIQKELFLASYLRKKFTLGKHNRPHKMKF